MFDFSIPYLSFLVADPPVELFAVDAEEIFSWVDDAALDGDGPSCVNVVACDHSHGDSGTLTLLDGVGHLNRDTKQLKIPFKGKFSLKHPPLFLKLYSLLKFAFREFVLKNTKL